MSWSEAAAPLFHYRERGWIGLWALLDATSHATLVLALSQTVGVGVDLAYAAIALGEARDEAEWLNEHLAEEPPVRLGPLHASDDLDAARRVVEQLVDAATTCTLLLIDGASTPVEFACLGRVLRKLHTAGEELTRVAS